MVRVLGIAGAMAAALLLCGCGTGFLDDDHLPPAPTVEAPDTPSVTVTPSRERASPTLASRSLRRYCRSGDPLAKVYRPWRLSVKSPCAAVSGVVRAVHREHDGDLHIKLTDVDRRWLNAENLVRDKSLVLEIVPGIPVPAPRLGERITVIGPWVLDTQTRWLEIHPVWKILPD
ncbi:MAG: hypothetical protein ACXV3C_02345 [Actinomycetes bacterium]